MIGMASRYPTYKQVDLPWLSEIPSHWESRRAKWLFTKMDRPANESDDVVTCFRDGIVTLRKNRRLSGFTESLKEIGYQGIRKGDLVIHAMDAFAGAVGVSDSDGKGTPVYSVCKPSSDANPYYYAYVIREMARNLWILALSKGIRERSTDFRFVDFAYQNLPLPPIEEQNAIVRYLDYMDNLIKRYIRAKQKEIQLLEELKRITIYLALTKGVYENGNCVESGVDWIGETPEHWETRTIKSCLKDITTGIWGDDLSDSTIEKRIICIRVADFDVRHLSVNTNNFTYRSISHTALSSRILEPGDILIEKSGGGDSQPVGRVVLFTIDSECVCSNFIVRLRPSLNIIRSQFLLYILFILQAQKRNLPSIKQTTGIQNLDLSEYFSNYISVPPLEEQDAIIDFIKEQFNMIETNIEVLNNQIAKVNLYQSRLISDIVTGKIAVTNLTAEIDQFTENIDMGYWTQFDETDEMLSMVDEEGKNEI